MNADLKLTFTNQFSLMLARTRKPHSTVEILYVSTQGWRPKSWVWFQSSSCYCKPKIRNEIRQHAGAGRQSILSDCHFLWGIQRRDPRAGHLYVPRSDLHFRKQILAVSRTVSRVEMWEGLKVIEDKSMSSLLEGKTVHLVVVQRFHLEAGV